MLGFAALIALTVMQDPVIEVASINELRRAVTAARPGTIIRIKAGDYPGGGHFANLNGTQNKPIIIEGADPESPPDFKGGSGLQFSSVSHVVLRNFSIRQSTGNGLNIDDGGTITSPSHHIKIEKVSVRDLPKGNYDGIKMSGVDHFTITECRIERWGGSAIDMVGCHFGTIRDSVFEEGGDNGVQAKGGSSDIRLQASRFINPGERGVNLGGSTGLQFFRPPVDQMSPAYEARNLTVEGCEFYGATAPIAFVGVDGATVRFNTFMTPDKWIIRILQETQDARFVPSRNGRFEDNLILYRSTSWAEGGVNIGPKTAPETFLFARNHWYEEHNPSQSRPRLPTEEQGGIYGEAPKTTKAGAKNWINRA